MSGKRTLPRQEAANLRYSCSRVYRFIVVKAPEKSRDLHAEFLVGVPCFLCNGLKPSCRGLDVFFAFCASRLNMVEMTKDTLMTWRLL